MEENSDLEKVREEQDCAGIRPYIHRWGISK